jgi:hypothetical protein
VTDSQLGAIRGTFNDLYLWGLRVQSPYRPAPGSQLAEDDADWPVMPLSSVAVSSMAAARDHLQAVRVHLDAGELFPLAQSSLIRTALLSAAQAVWVLAPEDRAVRVKNARTLTVHIYDELRKYLDDVQQLPSSSRHPTTEDVEHVKARLRALLDRRQAAGEKEDFNATKVIEDAAVATWGTPEGGLSARVAWRSGSSAAHGLLWHIFGRRGTRVGEVDAARMATFEAVGSVDDLAGPYFAAYGLLRKGFALLDRRGIVDGVP